MEDFSWDMSEGDYSSSCFEDNIFNPMLDQVCTREDVQCTTEFKDETFEGYIPSTDENTLCGGIFINDKNYNEHKAQDYFHQEEVERKAASDAIERGDFSAAKRHEAAANTNHKLAVDYQNMANKSTK